MDPQSDQTYPEENRFDTDANTLESVKKYYSNLATQLLAGG
jgi:hypothetical protein